MGPLLIFLAVVAVVVIWAIALYNRLIGLRNQTQNGWKQIDVQLKRRHDLIPNLVDTVKGSMEFERDTLTAVMDARARAMAATGPGRRGPQGRRADAGPRPAVRRGRELPAAQVEREREDAAGGTGVHGEQDRLRAPVLQRHRDEVQHRARDVPVQPVLRRASGSSGRNCSRSRTPRDRAVPTVDLSMKKSGHEPPRAAGRQSPPHVGGDGGVRRVPRAPRRRIRSVRPRRGRDLRAGGDAGGARLRRAARRGSRCATATAWCSRRRRRSRSSRAWPPRPPATTGCATSSSGTSSTRWRSRPACPGRRPTSCPTPIRTRSPPGRDPEHASIAVTEGLLRALNREELQGVVAHEMGHIRNFDIRLMMIIAALVGGVRPAVGLVGSHHAVRRRSGIAAGRPRQRRRLAGHCRLRPLADRDHRRADRGAAAGDVGLAHAVSSRPTRRARNSPAIRWAWPSALEKIDAAAAPTLAIKRGSAHLCIADPLGREAKSEGGGSVWATHPPIGKRIEALKAMAYAGPSL